jgi:hypothetical protein
VTPSTDQSLKDLVNEAVVRNLVLFDAQRPPAGAMPVMR